MCLSYQKAPPLLKQMLDTPLLPLLRVSPDGQQFVLLTRRPWPELADLAEPERCLAGLRLNPQTRTPSRQTEYIDLTLMDSEGQQQTIKGLPEHPRIHSLHWSPDGKKLAFVHTSERQAELWLVQVASAKARQVQGVEPACSLGNPLVWLSDSRALIVKTVSHDLPRPPQQVLPAPLIQENTGAANPGRTYQDLLNSAEDEAWFESLTHSQLMQVNLSGNVSRIGQAGLIAGFGPSPDTKYLWVSRIERPFSYRFPVSRFPVRSEIWSLAGEVLALVAERPLAERMGLSFDAVRPGARNLQWRSDVPADLTWFEALDQGDPDCDVRLRDALMCWRAPFDEFRDKSCLMRVPDRLTKVFWCDSQLALVQSEWFQSQQTRRWHLQFEPVLSAKELSCFSSEDRYLHPGQPLLQASANGRFILRRADRDKPLIYLTGSGASPAGERPFLDCWNLKTGKKKRLWQSEPMAYQRVVNVLDHSLLIRSETPDQAPNYYLLAFDSKPPKTGLNPVNTLRPLTHFPAPQPDLSQVHKRLIRYTRADGLELSATVYFPLGYSADSEPLPTVIWAYPREYRTAKAAGQVQGSPWQYTGLNPGSALVFLTQGYLVVDQPGMPIVALDDQEPNDAFVQQLVWNAEALVAHLLQEKLSDPQRLAIGGHSYGAFMAANLLVHTSLFQAGICRSGAYNRLLTPFGFQAEERHFWQASQIYLDMSPLLQANRIEAPLLLIHGQADDNAGTTLLQSELFYQALSGLGVSSRLVVLPFEGHHYRARESLEHMLWEMLDWLRRYL